MIIENLAGEVKEQKDRGRAEARVLRHFQKLYGCGQLSDLECAWDYYLRLSKPLQKFVRNYRSENGEIDLKNFYDRISDLSPSGIAGIVGQSMLKGEVWSVFTLSLEENLKKRPRRLRDKPYKAERRN